jgi:hypothetical protein
VSNDEDGKCDDVGECSHCNHQGITGTFCPLCKGTGFMHESLGVHQVWQENVWSTTCNRVAQMASNIQQLIRVGRAGNELPELGQGCFSPLR